MSESFLVRDISNILNFFKYRGVAIDITLEDALRYVKGE
jgi:serine/threonine-protein kinase RIO1